LGAFLLELSKGNPRNVELLFTEKPHVAGWAWQELRARRSSFITLRCAWQYFGFISDRLGRASKELDDSAVDGEALKAGAAKRFSKWLYHAHHKLFALRKLLETGEPLVALTGGDRDFVLNLRLQPPGQLAEAVRLREEAESMLKELSVRLEAAQANKSLPAEVDAESLLSWLGSVRARQAVGLAKGHPD